jgi:hypothetical protein
MSISLETVVVKYLDARNLSGGTRKEYKSTIAKWLAWEGYVDIDKIERTHIREFLDWVHEKAIEGGGSNPGRTANKARENLRAILSWAWEQDFIERLPRFPKPKPQRDVAGRHYLTKPDLNAIYFATYGLEQPRGWKQPFTVGHYWRAALVVFFNYGVDTEPFSSLPVFMSRFFGATSPGDQSHRTVKAKNHATVGSTIGV